MSNSSKAIGVWASVLATAMSLQALAATPDKTDPTSSVQPVEATRPGFMLVMRNCAIR